MNEPMSANVDPIIERQREIFLKALEQPTPAERGRYLERACGEDKALRAGGQWKHSSRESGFTLALCQKQCQSRRIQQRGTKKEKGPAVSRPFRTPPFPAWTWR